MHCADNSMYVGVIGQLASQFYLLLGPKIKLTLSGIAGVTFTC